MSVRTRLLAGFAGIFVPLTLLCILAISAVGVTNTNTTRLYSDRLEPSIALGQVIVNLDQMRQLGRPDPQFYEQGEFVVIFSRSSTPENAELPSSSARSSPSLSTSPRQKRSRSGTRHFYPTSQSAVMKRKKQKRERQRGKNSRRRKVSAWQSLLTGDWPYKFCLRHLSRRF